MRRSEVVNGERDVWTCCHGDLRRTDVQDAFQLRFFGLPFTLLLCFNKH